MPEPSLRSLKILSCVLAFNLLGPCCFAEATKEEPVDLKELIKQLHSDDLKTRKSAIDAVAKLGADAKDAVPDLILLLRDPKTSVYNALSSIGVAAVPALVEALDDEDPRIQSEAAFALMQIGPPAKAAVPTLTAKLRHRQFAVRHEALAALNKIGGADVSAVPALLDALRDELENNLALNVLRGIGPGAVKFIPELMDMLKEDGGSGGYAALVLVSIGPETVTPVCAALKGKSQEVRLRALFVLKCLGTTAKPALLNVIEVLPDKNEDVRASAAEALGAMGKDDRSERELERLSRDDPSENVRKASQEALLQIRTGKVPEPPPVQRVIER